VLASPAPRSENPDTPAVDLAELTGIPKKPLPQPERAHPNRAAAPAAPKPPAGYIVETVANGKVTISTFPVKAE
jgi:hypothetical protein